MEVNLKHKAIALLSRREHSSYELAQKLSRYTQDLNLINETIAFLKEKDLQSDLRFLEYFVHSHSKKWGINKILLSLKEHRLDDSVLSKIHEFIQTDESELAREIWENKFHGIKPSDLKQKAKQYRFLISRGFKPDIIRKIID
ncbi:regulatory protein RecX [Taylorella asinigenitalis 14/45]|uniref:Regulatory protein RecX n=1 Tax=Taylorella asinigenitalis 14/45 TaxID=1091495 RepID=I7JQP8_9BURK|nr:regulatory protein RecX [Taylorella asinigenitalis]CCG18854.1 regulatory protein RecX [Taylorella asinigenitalis 14/45]